MQHLSVLAARPDFHREMLRDRRFTHPDLLQHCADKAQLPLEPQPDGIAANSRLQRCLSRKMSSGGGSMRLLMKQASVKQQCSSLQDSDNQIQDQLIAVAYPSTSSESGITQYVDPSIS